ncbi:MAG TPA: copper homeostasis protein CutC [Candidatus Dormibacteraeota bacterium]|nr:copper homeostasis protein CutC [Candidatus Dormibacteraeota bacterium]
MTPLLEISVESLASAIAAERGGAHRIELCSDLSVGGVTPNAELMRSARAAVKVPIFAMIRPRGGNFFYSGSELAQMRRDIELAKYCKMDGVVLGILHADNTVDIEDTGELVKTASPLPVTFHRAFDETPDLHEALEAVIQTGATRILTSGGKPTAAEGTAVLADLVAAAADRIIILPGGGINTSNFPAIVRATRAPEFHSGLGTTLPYGQSSEAAFSSAVSELVSLLQRQPPFATSRT